MSAGQDSAAALSSEVDLNGGFWWVVDWLLTQPVEKVHDELLCQFLFDVEEDTFPHNIQARLQLRQLRKWLFDNEDALKGVNTTQHAEALRRQWMRDGWTDCDLNQYVENKYEQAMDLLESLDVLGKDGKSDSEYCNGRFSRRALLVPHTTFAQVKASSLASVAVVKGENRSNKKVDKDVHKKAGRALQEYVAKAEKALGPSYIQELSSGSKKAARGASEGVEEETIAEMPRVEESPATPHAQEEEAEDSFEVPAARMPTKKRRAEAREPVLTEEENDDETREVIERLKEGRKKLREIGGKDPLQEALGAASLAKENVKPQQQQEQEATPQSKKPPQQQQQANTFTKLDKEGGKKVEWETDDDEIETGSPVRAFASRVNQSSAGPTQRKSTRLVNPVTGRRIKAWWSKEEAEYLVELVMKYGKGKWKKILVAGKEDNYFDGRTPVDLKDKFRSLEKAASRIVGEG